MTDAHLNSYQIDQSLNRVYLFTKLNVFSSYLEGDGIISSTPAVMEKKVSIDSIYFRISDTKCWQFSRFFPCLPSVCQSDSWLSSANFCPLENWRVPLIWSSRYIQTQKSQNKELLYRYYLSYTSPIQIKIQYSPHAKTTAMVQPHRACV